MKRSKIGYLAAFLVGILATLLWQGFTNTLTRIYPVQFLRSPNRAHHAVLERTEGAIDLNFRVKLDDNIIYVSPDFNPDDRLVYRETLLWDDSGNILILEVAGKRLFGYEVTEGKPISSADLLQVKVTPMPLPVQ